MFTLSSVGFTSGNVFQTFRTPTVFGLAFNLRQNITPSGICQLFFVLLLRKAPGLTPDALSLSFLCLAV